MSDLFLNILNRSIAAGWVVLAVILARFLMRKAPKRVTCWLWLIVAVRLLTAGFPKTSFSLIPSTQTITPESLYDRAPVITSGVEIIDNVVNPVYTDSFRANELASVNPLQVWTAVAANIWLLVMIAIWLWAIISWLRIRRRVAASVCLRDNIYLCDAIDTPFILGMFNPKIYLPSSLTEVQQRHVIAHEQAHIHRLDHWYKPFAYFLLSINWFNPLIWAAYILLCRDIELAYDERVIERMTAGDKKGYSTALLECSIHRHMIAACPRAFGEVGVKERVKAVLSYKKPAFWVVLIAFAVCIALAVCFVTDPISTPPEIRWGGYLYVQEGGSVDILPDKIESTGDLRSTLHDSTPHPTEDGQSVGLDWEYAGQPLYLVVNALYLEEPGGGSWLKFVRSTENDPSQINYETFNMGNVSLSIGLPGGWEAETIRGDGYVGIRFRDKELSNGWISVKYWPDRQLHLNYAGIVRETAFPSGLSGSVYYLNEDDADEGIWDKVYFYSDSSYMSVEKPENYLWNTEYHDETMDVIGSITVTEDGNQMFSGPDLGIHLSVENPTPSGLTLVVNQDGTPWNSIYTGSNYNVARWYEEQGEWALLPQREGTAWTMVAYSVPLNETTRTGINWEWAYGTLEPGSYRIYKSYTGERGFLADRESVDQTCYAEFTIE